VVVLSGPVVAALVHCAVTLVQTGNLELVDAWDGLRVHWRRGVLLGALGGVLVGLAVFAIRFYGASSLWPPPFVALSVLLALGVYGLVLWTLAIAEPDRPLHAAARKAAELVALRPGATLVLGLALAVVNLAGIAAAVMPFLTLTVAYTFLVTAHFVL